MINRVYQLIRPSFFSIKYEDVSFYEEDTVSGTTKLFSFVSC